MKMNMVVHGSGDAGFCTEYIDMADMVGLV